MSDVQDIVKVAELLSPYASEVRVIGDCVLALGDSMRFLLECPELEFDAVVTDPPYSSGGMMRGDRVSGSSKKYLKVSNVKPSSFSGDNRDGHSFQAWMALWMTGARRLTKIGGYVMTFTDWRQVAAASDGMQIGGYVYRGLLAWNKGGAARLVHPGYFRHQAEFIVWGTNGPCGKGKSADYAGVYTEAVASKKEHPTQKPEGVMRWLVGRVPAGAFVLDPFMGGGSTAVAAVQTGRRFVGFECDREHFETACRRVAAAVQAHDGATALVKLVHEGAE